MAAVYCDGAQGDIMANDQSGPLSGTRVLVVEDEYYLADDLSRSLVQAGAQVVGPVSTLAEAEAKLAGREFDCAVVDMNLRGDFAYSFAEQLGATGMPLVVATGYNRTSLPDALKDVPRVEKPFSPHEVVTLLSQIREQAS